MSRIAASVLVEQLAIQGVNSAFCVPGESYLAVLDELYARRETIQLVTCRQEGGAAFMAAAYGKLTGAPGVCFVTRGPGACNASIGVHTAFHDAAPMLLFIGQIARPFTEREAFQEIDYRAMFGPIAKWVTQIDDAQRIPEMIARAWQLAVSGRPGPVVIALPEDMLVETCDVADAAPVVRVQASPAHAQMETLRDLLASAECPLLLLGGGDWSAEAVADIGAFAEAWALPVAAGFRSQDLFDNRSPLYVGDVGVAINPALAQRVKDADVIIAVGERLSETVTSDYTLLKVPRPQQTLVHVYPDPSELGRVYQAHLPIVAGMREFAAAARALSPVGEQRWTAWANAARVSYESWINPTPLSETLDYSAVLSQLRERLPKDTIITNGAGNYALWAQRMFQFSHFRTQIAPYNGTMGYGVPAAIAAKHTYPERTVVALGGDGCFLMTGQELATAVQHNINIVVIVVNNGMYGTIRMHQERAYPGHVVGTALTNPDFVAYAAAFGAHSEVVERTGDFALALERALNAGRPALIELRVGDTSLAPKR